VCIIFLCVCFYVRRNINACSLRTRLCVYFSNHIRDRLFCIRRLLRITSTVGDRPGSGIDYSTAIRFRNSSEIASQRKMSRISICFHRRRIKNGRGLVPAELSNRDRGGGIKLYTLFVDSFNDVSQLIVLASRNEFCRSIRNETSREANKRRGHVGWNTYWLSNRPESNFSCHCTRVRGRFCSKRFVYAAWCRIRYVCASSGAKTNVLTLFRHAVVDKGVNVANNNNATGLKKKRKEKKTSCTTDS